MNVYREVEREKELLASILSVARMRESLGFADLFRGSDNLQEHIERVKRGENPGVKFTTSSRTVVIEFHSGQLRFYAGGWASSEARLYEEQFRIAGEGYELGSFQNLREGLRFTEEYLVAARSLQEINVPRQILGRHETAENKV
jgi:hypothetical protein